MNERPPTSLDPMRRPLHHGSARLHRRRPHAPNGRGSSVSSELEPAPASAGRSRSVPAPPRHSRGSSGGGVWGARSRRSLGAQGGRGAAIRQIQRPATANDCELGPRWRGSQSGRYPGWSAAVRSFRPGRPLEAHSRIPTAPRASAGSA
jgi:hypothetical protein